MPKRFVRAAFRAAIEGLAIVALSACQGSPKPFTEQLVAPPALPPTTPRGGAHVVINLEAVEQQNEIAPGVEYTTWSFNGSTPGPLLRARVGDTVEVHLSNSKDSKNSHNIDLHAVNGPGGGAGATTVAPGESKYFTFKAKSEGLFVYHCAAGIVADHIANGMYGAILVEPPNGLDRVDHEYYVGQSEFYTNLDTSSPGTATLDLSKLLAEQAPYVTFNGATNALTGDKALKATVGQKVRIYFANGGPNLTSSFHVIGEIFDKAWILGGTSSPPLTGIQTVTIPPGGAGIVEFKVDVPGDYKLVDHALGRATKGAAGTLHVDGKANKDTFDAPGQDVAVLNSHGNSTVAAVPAVTATPTPSAPASPSAAATPGANTVVMRDNAFEPKELHAATAGQKVTFTLQNQGLVPHNMRIAPLDGNYDGTQAAVSQPDIILNGKSGSLTWTPAAPGTYKFRCDIHPDQMTGTIVVN